MLALIGRAGEAIELMMMGLVAFAGFGYFFVQQIKVVMGLNGVAKYQKYASKKLFWDNTWLMVKAIPIMIIAGILIQFFVELFF